MRAMVKTWFWGLGWWTFFFFLINKKVQELLSGTHGPRNEI